MSNTQSPSGASLQIPSEFIQPVIQAKINEAILSALDKKEALIAAAVQSILNAKVQYDGTVSSYSSYNTHNWIDTQVRVAIQEAAKGAISAFVAQNKEAIMAGLVADLKKRNSPLLNQLVTAMCNGLTTASTSQWALTVTVAEKKRD